MTAIIETKDSPLAALENHVVRKIMSLQEQYARGASRGTSWATATLARLRRFDPLDPATDPYLFNIVFDGMPDSLIGAGDAPSRSELATAIALHLYSVHQQGRPQGMHDRTARWGSAVRLLAARRGTASQLDPGVERRFQSLCTAGSPEIRVNHYRGMVTMLRGSGITVNYAEVAKDLYLLGSSKTRTRVTLRWGRDFHRRLSNDTDIDSGTTGPANTNEPN